MQLYHCYAIVNQSGRLSGHGTRVYIMPMQYYYQTQVSIVLEKKRRKINIFDQQISVVGKRMYQHHSSMLTSVPQFFLPLSHSIHMNAHESDLVTMDTLIIVRHKSFVAVTCHLAEYNLLQVSKNKIIFLIIDYRNWKYPINLRSSINYYNSLYSEINTQNDIFIIATHLSKSLIF